jgi:hypothetical protein
MLQDSRYGPGRRQAEKAPRQVHALPSVLYDRLDRRSGEHRSGLWHGYERLGREVRRKRHQQVIASAILDLVVDEHTGVIDEGICDPPGCPGDLEGNVPVTAVGQ